MHAMHSLSSVAIRPNLELKTRPKRVLGSLPLDIALPALIKPRQHEENLKKWFWIKISFFLNPIFPKSYSTQSFKRCRIFFPSIENSILNLRLIQ